MRTPILFVLLCLSPLSFATSGDEIDIPRDEETGLYAYRAVVEVPGATSAELYSRAMAWVAKTYTSAQDVVQLADQTAGRIIVKGLWETSSGFLRPGGWLRHMLTIEVKDGRYRYTLTNFVLAFNPPTGREIILGEQAIGIPHESKYFEDLAYEAKSTISSLTSAMAASGDEW